MPATTPRIGVQAETAILYHLLSKDKDKSLDHFKASIDWNYQDEKGVVLTEQKVRSRFNYLRKLAQESPSQFIDICVGKVDSKLQEEYLKRTSSSCTDNNEKEILSDSDEGIFSEDDEEGIFSEDDHDKAASTTTTPPTTPSKKRVFDTMTGTPLKKVKLEHHDIVLELGLPHDTQVISYTPGPSGSSPTIKLENLTILPANQMLPGKKNKLGGETLHSGPSLLEFSTIPQGSSHSFHRGPMRKNKCIVIDFGSIPLSANVLHEDDENSEDENTVGEELRMTMIPYDNDTSEIKNSKNLKTPVEHWVFFDCARTDIDPTVSGPINVPKEKPKMSKAAQLLNALGHKQSPARTPAAPSSAPPQPPAAAPSTPPPPPVRPAPPPSDNAHEKGGDGDTAMGSERSHLKRKADDPLQPPPSAAAPGPLTTALPNTPPATPPAASSPSSPNNSVGSVSLPSSFTDTSSEASQSGTTEQESLEEVMKKWDAAAKNFGKEAHEESKQSLNRSSDNNAHEKGGEGDTAMGSERSHLKRKAGPDDDGTTKPFRARNLFNTLRMGLNGGK
ncbi:unnamed protein product [Cylindrotheca closterium]|uniref:Uncharacterized protein n=1 Tax=Cylindrotheca closterium TaxID=2856 RepID=A0AAD2CVN3_9STRA|nr:unnamed protein product [Cylindrotheca closterium]